MLGCIACDKNEDEWLKFQLHVYQSQCYTSYGQCSVTAAYSLAVFKRQLKTFLFDTSFS